MRALVVVAVLAGGLSHATAQGRPTADLRTTPTGFDHMFHDRNLIVKNVGSLSCSSCHIEQRGKLAGKPGHRACFGACHGPLPTSPRRGEKLAFGDRTKICTTCHAESSQATPYAGKLAVGYPPYRTDPDFNIAFGHKQHATIACTLCHDLRQARPARAPHERCAGCHDGSNTAGRGTAMSKCTSCHPQAIGKPVPPRLAEVRDSVTATFSHAKHAARGARGKDCTVCHAAIRTTDDTQLPRPTMSTCATSACHDGKAAFATTAACTRCHDKAPDRFEVERPTARFSHEGSHAGVVSARACSACHALGSRGDTLVAGHDACIECHADEFAKRAPTICGACHNATEPWRPLVADRAPAERTEFGATLDHDKHPQECARCHSLRTKTAQLRPPRGHAACTGNGCHVVRTGPTPTLDTCSGCHRAGLVAGREQARLRAPWSARATFEHRTHAKAGDGSALACRACHVSLSGADPSALPAPTKATCAPCHDAGKSAFKLTGTTCSRCHLQRSD